MSSYVSKEGVFHPAKESVSLTNYGPDFNDPLIPGRIVKTGMQYIYEGPCRAALFDIWEANGKPEGVDKDKAKEMTIGNNFRKSPEFLQMLRDLNFKSAEDYLNWVGYDAKENEKNFRDKASVITTHDAPRKVQEIKKLGGGNNTAGKDVQYGGFGEPAGVK